MALTPLTRLTRDYFDDVRALRRDNSAKFDEWLQVVPGNLRPVLLIPIESQDWKGLAKIARQEISARQSDVDEMRLRQAKINQLFQRRNEFVMLSETTSGLGEIVRGLNAPNQDSAEQLDELAQDQFASLMEGTMALAVARFNLDEAAQDASALARVEKRLNEAKRRVYDALRAGDLLAASTFAADLAMRAANLLLTDTLPVAKLFAQKRQDKRGNLARENQVALQTADLIREALEGISLGSYLAWAAKWHPDATPIREWIPAAQGLPFGSAIKAPPAVNISLLANRPANKDGQMVTIEGMLGQVTITHIGRKAISYAPVSDADGKAVTIQIPYYKLDSTGMVPGAYVRVSGLWQKASKEVKNMPALMIDRLNYGDLSKASWSDWARAQLDGIFQPVPHNLAASWSWQLGTDGAGNPLRYGVSFQERR